MSEIIEREFSLIGGGGHCQSIINMLNGRQLSFCRGYTDYCSNNDIELPWLGDDSKAIGAVHIAVALGTDNSMKLRRQIINKFPGKEVITLISDNAIIMPGSSIGDGCAIMAGAIVNGASLEKHCIVNTGAIVEHGVEIGENSFIGPGAIICGGGKIGSNVVIGAGAVLKNGISICSEAIIGMGSTVVKDIDDPGVYVGTPARKIK